MKSGLGGLRAWLIQRISAVYLGVFSIFALLAMITHPHLDANQWRSWITDPMVLLALALFIILILAHAWVGVRDVIVDYVHPLSLRLGLMSIAGLFLISCGFWAARILLQVSGE